MERLKITGLEWAVMAITLLVVAVMAAYFWGSTGNAQPVSITAMTAPAPVTSAPPEGSESPAGQFPVDINTATVEELQTLPSIGVVRAQAIVDYRAEHGPFTYVEDLRGVKGIGEGILNEIMDYVTVGGTTNGENTGG